MILNRIHLFNFITKTHSLKNIQFKIRYFLFLSISYLMLYYKENPPLATKTKLILRIIFIDIYMYLFIMFILNDKNCKILWFTTIHWNYEKYYINKLMSNIRGKSFCCTLFYHRFKHLLMASFLYCSLYIVVIRKRSKELISKWKKMI